MAWRPTKVKSQCWLSMLYKTAEQRRHRGKVHTATAFWVNKVDAACKFPWQRDAAHRLSHLSVTKQWSLSRVSNFYFIDKDGPLPVWSRIENTVISLTVGALKSVLLRQTRTCQSTYRVFGALNARIQIYI